MGWDTEIVILAENIKNETMAINLSELIFEKDARNYGQVNCFLRNSDTLFYHYERIKYAPCWIIKDISKQFREIKFTVLASCPCFVGGPAGLIRIAHGEISDSYGIGEIKKSIIRSALIEEPLNNIPLIYEWFRFKGKEEMLRAEHLNNFPKGCCEENYAEKIIPITDTDELKSKFTRDYKDPKTYQWYKI